MLAFASDSSVFVRFEAGAAVGREVLQTFHALQRHRARLLWSNLHPAYASLLIDFDPGRHDPHQFINEVRARQASPEPQADLAGSVKKIPVRYGGVHGQDLAAIADGLGLTSEEVVHLHAATEYTVAFLGFAPGFPYLAGLPERLHSHRHAAPRLR